MGRYRLENELGEGGFGVVYAAFDVRHEVRLAVKVLRQSDAASLARFKREFRALASIAHPNVVELYDLVVDGPRWCFTMEQIEGCDLRSYVRGPRARHLLATTEDGAAVTEATTAAEASEEGDPRDAARYFAAFAQLATGIEALHEHGVLHCDLKPSNVLVDRGGRVVIVDFGLVGHERVLGVPTSARHAGTPGYMAPEQLAGEGLTSATDWYAFGVLLFELWTGHLPFEGTAAGIAGAALHHEAPRLADGRPDTPAVLASLCAKLLARDPAARAGSAEVRECFASLAPPCVPAMEPVGSTVPPRPGPTPEIFVGRGTELSRLREAFAEAEAGRRAALFVAGASGIGKTALVERFLEEVSARALVVNNACFAREDIPFKALDGVGDALARALSLDSTEAASPRVHGGDLAALARIFPAIRGHTASDGAADRDPVTLRVRAAQAAAVLLRELASGMPIVLVVDDVQWSDRDSEVFLRLLFARLDGALLVCTWQRVEPRSLPPFDRLAQDDLAVQVLDLEPLPSAEAETIAASLVSDRTIGRRLVQEAAGNPFLLHQLAHDLTHGAGATSLRTDSPLGTMLDARLAALSPRARALLDVLCVAGGPVDEAVAARTAGSGADTGPPDGPSSVHALVARGFVRILTPRRGARLLTLSHGQIGRLLGERLTPEATRRWHAALASTMEAAGETPVEALAMHWALAGDHPRAAPYAAAAAATAAKALAFERAAALYAVALEHSAKGSASSALRVCRGEALANAGHGRAAAEEFLAAAESSSPRVPGAALELRRRAAEQLLQSGYVSEGLLTLRRFVRSVGLPAPAVGVWRLPRLAWARLGARRAMARTSSLAVGPAVRIDDAVVRQADVSWAVSTGLGFLDPIAAAEYSSRHTAPALSTRDPLRVVRALTSEAMVLVGEGEPAWPRVEALIARAEGVARGQADAVVRSMCDSAMGVAAGLSGRFELARTRCELAETVLADRVRTEPWQLATVQHFALYAALMLGDLDVLCRRAPVLLREYADRDNRYAASGVATNYANLAWLVTDGPRAAREVVQRAERWFPATEFHLPHYDAAISHTHLDMYEGRADSALERVETLWKWLRASLMLSVEPVFVDAMFLRLRATVAAARSATGLRRVFLLGNAEVGVRRLKRARSLLARPLGLLLEAGILAIRNDQDRAETCLRAAIVALDASGLVLFAASARLILGHYVGEARGRALRSVALSRFSVVPLRDPERFASIFVPGFPP